MAWCRGGCSSCWGLLVLLLLLASSSCWGPVAVDGRNHPRRALLETQAANQRDRRFFPQAGNNAGGGWGGGSQPPQLRHGGGSAISIPPPAPAPQWTQPSRGGGNNNNWMQGNGGGDQGRGTTPRGGGGGGGGSWWQQPPRPAAPAPIVLPTPPPTPPPQPPRQPDQQPIRGWGGNRGGGRDSNREERDRDMGDRANRGPLAGQPLQGLPGWMGSAGGSSGLQPASPPAWQVRQPVPGGQPIRDGISSGRDADRGEGRSNGAGPGGSSLLPGAGARGELPGVGRRDRPDLSRFTGGLERFRGISARPINTEGDVGSLSRGIAQRGNSRAAAESLADAVSSGRGEAAAQAVASAAAGGGAAAAVGEALAEATSVRPGIAPGLLRRSADYAVSNGHVDGFSRSMSRAFGAARERSLMGSFVPAVCDAISGGGDSVRYAYGSAIATAISSDGTAVAEATATALCQGGSRAEAFASAYAVALQQNSQGCLVLNQARAMAYTRCGAGAAEAWSRAEATSTVLGFCGLWGGDGGFGFGK